MGAKGMKHQRLRASFWVVPNQTLRSLMFDRYVRFDSATIFHQRVNITSPENLGWNCVLKLLKREYQQITNIIIWNHVLSSIVLFIGSSIMYSPKITFYIHFTSLLVRCFVPGNPVSWQVSRRSPLFTAWRWSRCEKPILIIYNGLF